MSKCSLRFDQITPAVMSQWVTKKPKEDGKKQGHNIYVGESLGQLGPRIQLCRFMGPRCRMIKVHTPMDNTDPNKPKDERTISFFLPGPPDQEAVIKCIKSINDWGAAQVKKNWIDVWKFGPLKRNRNDVERLKSLNRDPNLIYDEDVEQMNEHQDKQWGGCLLTTDKDDPTKFAPLLRVKGYFKEIPNVNESPYEKMTTYEKDGRKFMDRVKIQPTQFLSLIEAPNVELIPTIEVVKIYRKSQLWQISLLLVGGVVVPTPERKVEPMMDEDEKLMLEKDYVVTTGKRQREDESEIQTETPDSKIPKTESNSDTTSTSTSTSTGDLPKASFDLLPEDN